MNALSRRRFLKISAASVTALGAAGTGAAALGRRAEKAAEQGIRHVPTFCDICFWKCGAIATVRDGKLWKIEGNPLDPLCQGRLCPRGTGGIGAHSDRTACAPRSSAPTNAARKSGRRRPGTRLSTTSRRG
jgi:thiosulfate reductase/polysulfide reductase chain A